MMNIYKILYNLYIGLGSWQTLDTSMGRWYRSKDSIAGKNPYFGYLSNKKWPLNEAITKHLLYFAQVIVYFFNSNYSLLY